MVLQELFDNLAHGEFSNLAVGNSATGSIKQEAYPKVVTHINRALKAIYKRFILKKKTIWVHQQADLSTYYLRSAYLIDTVPGPDAYLSDLSTDPFEDDLVNVLYARDGDGEDMPLNNPRYPDTGIFTQAADTLEMTPDNDDLQVIQLTYQAFYPRIVITETFSPETYPLYFPAFIEEALMVHIASQLFKGKTSKASEGEGYGTNTFEYRFDKACQEIEDLGLAEPSEEKSQRFTKKGFV